MLSMIVCCVQAHILGFICDCKEISLDTDDFTTLVPPQMGAVLRLAAALVGSADAEDAAQEAIVRAWQAWPSLRNRDATHTWLLRITANICLNWKRGRFGTRQRTNQPFDDGENLAALRARETDNPGSNASVIMIDVLAAIESLDPPLHTVVALRYFGGFDATEIGDILDTPPSTIRSRLNRALTLIRANLALEDATLLH